MELLDCKGHPCPQPVLKTRAYILAHPEAETFSVVVDNRASAENVMRFLESQGFQSRLEESSNEFVITAYQSCTVSAPETSALQKAAPDATQTLVVIVNDVIGNGDRELGAKLMLNFLKTLSEMGESLWRIILLNDGVRLSIEGAETLPVLQQLASDGVSILVCGTCLNYYQLLEKKQVGETTNMLDVVTSMQLAAKIIHL